jgi:hypothetical protein
MPTDHKAFTIVTAFLGMVMFGFWIAHACALYHPNQPAEIPPSRIQAFADVAATGMPSNGVTSNGMTSHGADIPFAVIVGA